MRPPLVRQLRLRTLWVTLERARSDTYVNACVSACPGMTLATTLVGRHQAAHHKQTISPVCGSTAENYL